MFELFFYILLYWIDVHSVFKLLNLAGILTACNYINGVESTYDLLTASFVSAGVGKPVNLMLVNVKVCPYLSRLNTTEESEYIYILF